MKMKKTILGFALLTALASAALGGETIEVYKSPDCGCCGKWGEIMKKNGFEIVEHKTNAIIETKNKYGIPPELSSCHTGIVGGYAIEGHVPAEEIKALLAAKPADVVGISVPGMPLGSPGMEQGGIVEDYDVIAFKKDGTSEVFASYKNGKKTLFFNKNLQKT